LGIFLSVADTPDGRLTNRQVRECRRIANSRRDRFLQKLDGPRSLAAFECNQPGEMRGMRCGSSRHLKQSIADFGRFLETSKAIEFRCVLNRMQGGLSHRGTELSYFARKSNFYADASSKNGKMVATMRSGESTCVK